MTKKASMADIERIDLVFLAAAPEPVSLDGVTATAIGKHSRHTVPEPQAKRYLEDGIALKVEDLKWTPRTPPAEYLDQNPKGKSAGIARILVAHPRLAKDVVKTEADSMPDDSSAPSDDSSGP